MRLGLVSIGLVLLLGAGVGPASADEYDETEYRLKTAEVPEDLREQIHVAIRRGVAHLRRFQKADGSFDENPGHTTLAGLALRHAAIPDGVEGSRKAIEWLRKAGKRKPVMTTYGVGLLAMLLTADNCHPEWNQSLHARFAKGPRKDKGYWGYKPSGGYPPPNLSTAQFACLGLWAGERAGAKSATKAWRRHLDALLLAQQPDGSWGYSPGRAAGSPHAWGLGYPTGTYMGIANLALAAEALREELRENPRLWSRTLLASAIARAALRRHVAWEFDSTVLPVTFGSLFPYYRLYAIEKACIFLDLEDVAGRRWYEEGARTLLANQQASGAWRSGAPASWGFTAADKGSPIDTSFALLFLLRASHAYHPITPRPVDRRGAVITPGDEPLEPEGADPAPVPTTSLENANALLDGLDAWFVQRKLDSPARAIDDFSRVRTIYAEYRPDGRAVSESHDEWCRRAETFLLQAATRFARARPRYRDAWQAVAIQALDTLATTDRRVTPRLMRAIETMPSDASFAGPVRFGWYSAAFDALRRLEAPALASWIVDRMLSPELDLWHRTSAALTTLGGIHGLKGHQRHAAALGVYDFLLPLHRKGGTSGRSRDLQIDAMIAIRRLANSEAVLFTLVSGSLPKLVAAVRSWWHAHGMRSDRAWAD